MSPLRRFLGSCADRADARTFARSASGIASVEFALFSSILMLLFAGSFDLVYMVSARRDSDRASMLAARVLVSCPSTACILDTMDKYYKRRGNILWRYPDAEVGLGMIQKTGTNVVLCAGTSKTLDTEVATTAKTILADDGDVGASAAVKLPYTSILPKALFGYIPTTGKASFGDHTVDLYSKSAKVC